MRDHTAEVEHRHLIAHTEHHRHVVLDEENGHAPLVGELAHEARELGGLVLTESGGGLVEQQHRWLGRDGACERDEPALPERQLLGTAIEVLFETELAHDRGRGRAERRSARMHEVGEVREPVALVRCRAQVLAHRHAVEQLEVLERAADSRDGALRADHVVTSSPSSSTRPAVGFAKPVSASISVDLPAPFGPIKPSTWFGRTVIDTPSSASTTPNRTLTPSASRVFGAMVGRPPSSSAAPFVTCFTHPRDEAREAVRHGEQHHEHEDPERELHGRLALEEVAERVGDDRARRERGADERTGDEADAADHRVEHDEDRLEHRERRVEDDARSSEPDEHAAHGRDRGPEPERVELGSDDADAERSGGALVRAHRDEPSSGAPSPQVGDAEREHDEAHEREHRVPLGMGGGVEVEPEERDRADLRAGDAAGAPRVVEDEALDDERETERRDGEVHPSRAERG